MDTLKAPSVVGLDQAVLAAPHIVGSVMGGVLLRLSGANKAVVFPSGEQVLYPSGGAVKYPSGGEW